MTTNQNDATKPGNAWVWDKAKGKWVKPAVPKGQTAGKTVAWDDNLGWINQKQQADAWGYPLAVINSDTTKGPNSLPAIFQAAWQAELNGQAWSQETFMAKIKASNWAMARSDAQRNFDILANDKSRKAEYDSQIAKSSNDVERIAAQQGIHLSPEQIKQVAVDRLRNNYSETDLQNIFAKTAGHTPEDYKKFFDNISGQSGVGADKNTILNWAKDNGVAVSEDWVGKQLAAIESNQHDVQWSKDYITRMAKLAYPSHADYLDNKTSVMDVAQTYAQKISSMLEVPFERINLSNQHLQKALQPDESGKPKNLMQVEQELRGTSDWAKTKNAKETVNGVVNGILGKFGLI